MHFPKTLVLGATGRIGTILRRYRLAGAVWQCRGRAPDARPGWCEIDPLTEPERLARAAADCAAILCLAGVTNAHGGDLADNAALAEAAVRAGGKTGARVLLASSAAVYGNQPGRLAETAPLRPAAPYGRAKVEMEARGIALGGGLGVPVTALRICNIAGLDAILGGWRPGFALDVFADGRSPRRSYIGPLTLARVLEGLLAAPDLPPVLNVAGPAAVGMGDLLDAAGLGWTARPAPDTAIPSVELDTAALDRHVPLDAADGDPVRMVAEWRSLEPESSMT